MTTDAARRYDVIAVNLTSKRVRLLESDKALADAEAIVKTAVYRRRVNAEFGEAIVKMAVYRRRVNEEFYVVVATGTYQEGEQWTGHKATTEAF